MCPGESSAGLWCLCNEGILKMEWNWINLFSLASGFVSGSERLSLCLSPSHLWFYCSSLWV